jgi:hypothetical protein
MAAVATCARCGGFLCGECTEVVGEAPYCAPCVAILKRDAKPSRVIQWALVLNVAGLACLPCALAPPLPTLVAGVLGVSLGGWALRRTESGGKARTRAWVVLALGVLNGVLAVGWLVVLRVWLGSFAG